MSAPGENVSDGAAVSAEAKANRSRMWLFLLLLIVTSVPLFLTVTVPNKPVPASMDMYTSLMKVPDGSTVIIQSDWTNSTRGESGGEMEAVLRILMRKNCKFALYSAADPQAPQVARDTIMELNTERDKNHERQYERWNDYVVVGYFPNAEGANNAMVADIRKAWAGKKDVTPQGQYESVWNSPVLKGINSLSDVPIALIMTASNSFNIFVERVYGKVPMAAAVTGVMGPESQVYYASGQLKGLATGLKGVYDLETMMQYGINTPDKNGKIQVEWAGHEAVPPSGGPGDVNFSKGASYYPTLHFALTLLIFAVITGNVLMFRAKRKARS